MTQRGQGISRAGYSFIVNQKASLCFSPMKEGHINLSRPLIAEAPENFSTCLAMNPIYAATLGVSASLSEAKL